MLDMLSQSIMKRKEYAPIVSFITFIKSKRVAFVCSLFLAKFAGCSWHRNSSLRNVVHLGTQGLGRVSFARQLLLTSSVTQVMLEVKQEKSIATNTKPGLTDMRLGISTFRTWSSSSICFCDKVWKSANFTSLSFAAKD